MCKSIALIILVIIGLVSTSQPFNNQPTKLKSLVSPFNPSKVNADLCPTCINEVVTLVNALLNIILDEGIVQSCGLLCGALANKTGSIIIGDICDVGCEALGIDEFVKLLIKSDIDPIYYCQLVKLCPIKDDGDAKFTNFGVMPKTAPDGSKFVIDCSFITRNGTGTGTISIDIIDPKNQTQGNIYWFEERKPGTYPERFGIETVTTELNCDPATGCNAWPIGTYNVIAQKLSVEIMYKGLAIVLITIFGIASASKSFNVKSHSINRVIQPQVRLDLCPTCINVAEESINILLNLILDSGIVGTCGTLCQALAEKTGSQLIGTICDLACDVIGIDEFIKLIEKADLDPIWYCEIARFCPINDHGDAKITKFSILPTTGRQGTTFVIDFSYISLNGTGTGELDVDIRTPDHIPLGAGFLIEAKKPGTYNERISVKAEPDPECDPTQQPCEEWLPGIYNVTVQICNGECGSKHPHSATYDSAKGAFSLTG
ncbi:unnamed protein product [Rotaria magnacalcarata]|uniref:Saposin B-type domain-containing protein n=2 Tax=Rotaria magnacalcarata TaxID=392030 RepID=A0A815V0B9_9BILA|nr:unnamed protein product [Rotaria magnacalcarata]CAF3772313.1 unnamed protein product [Rotaria magnacalcarata]CAF3859294.1 unnamed protein product [Rotaria magnacalcarata]CAF4230442.1 unnamed protein product [Rotaria magnacalcarata]